MIENAVPNTRRVGGAPSSQSAGCFNSFLVSLWVILAAPSATSLAAISFEAEGSIEHQFFLTNVPSVHWSNWFRLSVSGCRTVIRTGGMSDQSVEFFEHRCDGTKSSMLIKYRPELDLTTWKPRVPANEATLIVNNGLVPEYSYGIITPIWIA